MNPRNLSNSTNSITGVHTDLTAGVTIGTVFNGYFNSSVAARAFNEIGVARIMASLGPEVTFADFGGGDGYLAANVQAYLMAHKHRAQGVVIDMNSSYLELARERGLETVEACLDEAAVGPLDLAIARAILHYNPLKTQAAILRNVAHSLKPGGYMVHSVSSGDAANCALRTEIAALPSLGRTRGDGSVYFITPDTYIKLANEADFAETKLVGYAPDNSWTLVEMFTRFNPPPLAEDSVYQARKREFLHEALRIITHYRRTSSIKGIQILENNARVTYRYPIFISKVRGVS